MDPLWPSQELCQGGEEAKAGGSWKTRGGLMLLLMMEAEVVVDDLQCPVQTITRMSSSSSPPSAATSSPRAASTEGCALAAAACTAAPSAGVEGGVSGGVSARIRWLKKSCAHRFPEPGYSQPEII